MLRTTLPELDLPAGEGGRVDGQSCHDTMRRHFSEALAARAADFFVSHFEFAGQAVQLRVVGRDLHEHLVRPFAHLCSDRQDIEPAALTIDVWDVHPSHPAHPARLSDRETDAFAEREWHETTLQSPDGSFIVQRLPNTLSCLDRRTGHLVAAIDWHQEIFIYERAKPWARLLLNWYNDRGIQLVHAGLVARGSSGIMLAGKSGSGKSTTSLACALAGFDFLGEDYVGLEMENPHAKFVGHSIYNSVFLESRHLERFIELAPHAIHGRPPHELKSALILSAVLPQRLRRSVSIAALVFPRIGTSPQAQIGRISKGAALLALAPSSLLQIPNRQLGAAGFKRLADLVERLPCYGLSVGEDIESLTRCLSDLAMELEQ